MYSTLLPPEQYEPKSNTWKKLFTYFLIGASCFFLGSLMQTNSQEASVGAIVTYGSETPIAIGGFADPTEQERVLSKDETHKIQHYISEVDSYRQSYKVNRESYEATMCPWVDLQISPQAHLFASVTITADGTLKAILDRIKIMGIKKVKVFSGRHGYLPNPVDQATDTTIPKIFDQKLYDQDAANIAAIKDLEIDLVNTVDHATGQGAWLKAETKKALDAGVSVVYAWCFSIAAFRECSTDVCAVNPKDPGYKAALAQYLVMEGAIKESTIAQIVTADYGWLGTLV